MGTLEIDRSTAADTIFTTMLEFDNRLADFFSEYNNDGALHMTSEKMSIALESSNMHLAVTGQGFRNEMLAGLNAKGLKELMEKCEKLARCYSLPSAASYPAGAFKIKTSVTDDFRDRLKTEALARLQENVSALPAVQAELLSEADSGSKQTPSDTAEKQKQTSLQPKVSLPSSQS